MKTITIKIKYLLSFIGSFKCKKSEQDQTPVHLNATTELCESCLRKCGIKLCECF